ncbi:fluoroquinolone resistance protein [Inquilinus ginsengisoli]|uniref:Fluoroquinolone resistance protein n=1 Tax=Inquilinus ginsengisoli TaxID=363840 RepID=A0ABU1JL79_9PROT|nr:pentapeptide repeat-containing protein [Inquilinus ginsengisoli]MDR6289374.1 fluoroquinolone resistance protein [Inquilinus ginsengisoli]
MASDPTPIDLDQFRRRLAAGDGVSGAALCGVEWPEAAGAEARFADCLFEDCGFAGGDLTGAEFRNCRFLRCRFASTSLRDAVFEDCVFTDRAASTGTVFAFSELRDARFARCDLSFSGFERSGLFGIAMTGCNLLGAKFDRAEFSHAFGRKTISTRAEFRDCRFELADLHGIRLPGCTLVGCDFREADLTDADLSEADLRDSDLTTAVLAGAALAGADLRGAAIAGLNLLALRSLAGLKIGRDQQHALLAAMGVDVVAE